MPTPNTSNKKAKLNPNGLKRVFKMVWNDYKWLIIIIAILVCVNSFANVYGNAFQQRLIDDYITPMLATSSKDFSPLLSAIIQMIVIYAIGVVASYVLNRLTVKISLGTLNNVRERLFAHMQTLPIKYFDTHPHGDIMSVYTNDTDTLRQTISSSIPQVFSSLITIIMVIISMFSLSWILALITLSFSILMLFIAKKITHKSGKYFRQQQRELGHVNGYIEEMIEGSRVIKVFSHEQQVQEDFDKINDTLCQASTKANTFANILMPICMNFGYVSYVVCAIVGSYFAIHGMFNMTVGTIAAMLSLNKAFNNPITQISQQLNAVIMSQAGAARIFEILDEPSESDSGIVTLVRTKLENDQWVETKDYTGHWCWKHPRSNNGYELVPLKGDVIFDDVTFGYNEDKTVLHDINLYAHAGQKVALVGATGAGKTTITNLVNRFYDIQKGTITYDGINIELIEKPDLRRSLGVVLQDTQLFSGTIMDNIRFGKLDATDEECIAAAKLARADSFINHLENGYNTYIHANGESLSQGQRQLLAIARAAVANPPVLILDEATSSIDTRTERLVQEGMDELMKGRTVFVIAHRLSTIMNSDAIMVLDQGRIIERGNHDSLIEKKGIYYQLYTGALEID
ncbi:ABC transporter ATP-binding protein [Allobaculum stercoricanis]|uniref:ABC transporter ATP-binding protein n=1 Tax=Allobaculum stercoricanis TaxID=174709 RepID=UPI000371EB13|nr:ABC transporter ATP-binding protein [Allobaculum stercoricanis]